MDNQTIIFGICGVFIALILFKFIIKLPFLLLKYGILALFVYAAYMFFTGRLSF